MATTATLVMLLLQLRIPLASALLRVWVHECDNVNGNYTLTSPYKHHLNALFSQLPNINHDYGFYNLSAGNSSDVANLLSICRGDVDITACHTCQFFVIDYLKNMCPNQKSAIAWSDDCMVRYSSGSIFGVLQETPYFDLYNRRVFDSNVEQFSKVVGQLFQSLPVRASSGDSRLKFATSEANINSTVTIYAAVQCTPDLNQKDCLKCLNDAVREIKIRASGKRGARFLFPSCSVRYELYKFYLTTSSDFRPSFSSSPTGKGKEPKSSIVIVAIGVPVIVLLLLIVVCVWILRRKAYKKLILPVSETEMGFTTVEILQFDFISLQYATQNFSHTNKIGEGGFGSVYKGVLVNGREIAVKRLSRVSDQGEEEFKNEALLLAKLQHRNLVKLLGYCSTEEERLLVYEFVPNHSLDHFLFDARKQGQLDWPTRFKIICGIARGMLYLHEDSHLRIIHRDLKASNILLDEDMNPKIADFGLARIIAADRAHDKTKKVAGTHGYMAPEYVREGEYSAKSDVFSYGVLVLEIITGKKNSSFHKTGLAEDLPSYAWHNWEEGTPLLIMDSTLKDISVLSSNKAKRCIHTGLLCIPKEVDKRPSMAEIVHMLNTSSFDAPLPQQPDFFVSRMRKSEEEEVTESNLTRSKSTPSSTNHVTVTRMDPR